MFNYLSCIHNGESLSSVKHFYNTSSTTSFQASSILYRCEMVKWGATTGQEHSAAAQCSKTNSGTDVAEP